MVDAVPSRALVSVHSRSSSRRGCSGKSLSTALCPGALLPFRGIFAASIPSLDLQPCAYAYAYA